ncbi:exo-alpha-sialidase [Luteolibacter ambystomatis]|uniref:exo-alpha-sialidase n=1 Tax=Luteolibacter ambystomatis TaxID=2824561 RepID=A0A975G5U6_9BACT|nr:sialidase family protein [Luteolibacter ambystomatis]QUE49644.1 exo-alpha-sialidase [Luteolibacter ambystomatis]
MLPFIACLLLPAAVLAAEPAVTDLFRGSGHAPDHTYRIPSLAVTPKGALLAFAELRKNNGGDTGDIDIVLRRSDDGGKTWKPMQVIADFGMDTIGNATPIVDQRTGRITVLAQWNRLPERKLAPGFGEDSRRLYQLHSDDDGMTWSRPENITEQVKQPSWSWLATGPGAGIVLTRGTHKGRYVAGINHRETAGDAPGYYAHAIYSDDSGKTWKSSRTYASRHTNECEIAELTDGSLMLNMRNHGSNRRDRAIAISKDGGETWEDTRWDANLPEPQCMGSIRRATWPSDFKPGLILFSNPASRKSRQDLILRGSLDEGVTWPLAKLIKSGDAAYSHLATLPDGTIAIAYETDRYSRIALTTIQPADLQSAPEVANPDGTLKENAAR